jgi:predicted TIM-barrel fold metal-dependent hydrolase
MVGMYPTHKLDITVERLVREMDAYRVAASIAVSTIGVFHDHALGNTATLDAAKGANRVIPAATINPKHYFGSASDVAAIRRQGFRLFRFFPDEQGWPVDSPAFAQVLKHLAEIKSPVMIDAAEPGEPGKIARAVADYPSPVILSAVSIETLAEALAAMADAPNLMIETHELRVPDGLSLIADRVGAERIIFGSGAPRRSVAGALQYVYSSALSDEDKQHVLGGNIKRILEAA